MTTTPEPTRTIEHRIHQSTPAGLYIFKITGSWGLDRAVAQLVRNPWSTQDLDLAAGTRVGETLVDADGCLHLDGRCHSPVTLETSTFNAAQVNTLVRLWALHFDLAMETGVFRELPDVRAAHQATVSPCAPWSGH